MLVTIALIPPSGVVALAARHVAVAERRPVAPRAGG
jgi:hypothetical protein